MSDPFSPHHQTAPFFVDQEVIVLTENGTWLADGTEITHEPTRKLFSKSLKNENGKYSLKIGRETKQIEVQDTAYFVMRIDGDLQNGLSLLLNDESTEKLDPGTLQYRPGRLTCKIKKGTEEARLLRPAYNDLLKNLKEDENSFFLEFGSASGKTRIILSKKSAA